MSTLSKITAAFETAGWRIEDQEPVRRGTTNPTRLTLVRGRSRLPLLVYVWRITGEGAGRTGTNYRIQTTRSHDGDLMMEPDRLTVGLGLDNERGVIAAFDGWTKRATGSSSSVHIKRLLLDTAKDKGTSAEGPRWDARVASRLDHAGALISSFGTQKATRTAPIRPLEWAVSDDRIIVTADIWDSAPASWLRPADNLILANSDGDGLLNDGLWRVDKVEVAVVNEGERYPRRSATFEGHRLGYVKNPEQVLLGLIGRTSK